MKNIKKLLALGALVFADAVFAGGTTATTADAAFGTFSDTAVQWFTGNLGYLIALFAFVGTVILYAFTHRHSILFIGFLIAFFAGAGAGIANMGFTLGSDSFTAPTAGGTTP